MIRLASKEETNAAGIIINTPETEKKRIDNGIVVKVGPGRQAGNGVVMPIQVTDHSTDLISNLFYQYIFV